MIESIRRVSLSWPRAESTAIGTGPTLAAFAAAFAEWITEAHARGCPDSALVTRPQAHPTGDGDLVVWWHAADDLTVDLGAPAVLCEEGVAALRDHLRRWGPPPQSCAATCCRRAPDWRLDRHDDDDSTWACSIHLANIAEALQRPQDGSRATRFTLIPIGGPHS